MTVVNLIYRAPRQAFSIENVFDAVHGEFVKHIPVKRTYMKYQRANLPSMLRNIKIARDSQEPVNHITGDIHYTMLGLNKRNFNILTVHDLVILEYLSGVKRAIGMHLWLTIPLRRASLVTAISTKTARELVELVPQVEDKIHVVHDPVSPAFCYLPKPKLSKRPRLLHLGTKNNKNLDRVIEAVAGLEVQLVIIGMLSEATRRRLKERNIDYVNLSNLSQEAVVAEYENCDMVLFPSLYEGFGLPIVEANAVGRPVITSNLEPMKEVAGDAALSVNPREVSEIRGAIEALIGNNELRGELVDKGLVNQKRFRPEMIASQYMKLYSTASSTDANHE